MKELQRAITDVQIGVFWILINASYLYFELILLWLFSIMCVFGGRNLSKKLL